MKPGFLQMKILRMQNKKSPTAAIYLVGHGPLREPRPLELQRFRIQRYIDLLLEQAGQELTISTDAVFVDINYPRQTAPDRPDLFPALRQLRSAISTGRYSHVFVDIAPPVGPQPGIDWIPSLLSHGGTNVTNVYYEERSLLNSFLETRGATPYDLAHGSGGEDSEDFFTFFPVLAGRVLSCLVHGILEDVPYPLASKIEQLHRENPYRGGRFPKVSGVILNEVHRKAWEQEQESKKRRSLKEPLLRLTPDASEEAVLLDDAPFGRTRTKDQWLWVEKRLAGLNFEKTVKGRVTSFTRRIHDFIVYADPRAEDGIRFCIYRTTAHAKPGRPSQFWIPDRWKNNLEEKLLREIKDHAPVGSAHPLEGAGIQPIPFKKRDS